MCRALVGPTASGKSAAALALAEQLGVEIASVDSMLVYRGMDVGTAKPTPARPGARAAPSARPGRALRAVHGGPRFQDEARQVLAERSPLLVGGSGLYFRAVVDGLVFPPEDPVVRSALQAEADELGSEDLYARLADADPVAAAKIDPGERPPDHPGARGHGDHGRAVQRLRRGVGALRPVAGAGRGRPHRPRRRSRRRIRRRVGAMLDAGWLDEVRALVARGFGAWFTATQAIGYAEVADHLDGRLELDEAVEQTVKRTKRARAPPDGVVPA